MSEYQFYEFRTVDRVLTAGEIDKLNELSSRAEVTPTGFSVTYNYSDFRGKPERLMERYFDAFVYVANWGTRRFMMRLPTRGIDLAALDDFANEALTFWIKDEFVILSFEHDEEGGGGWEEGEGWMQQLISLREELLNGDFRSLYLGWLCGTHYDEEYDQEIADDLEPPVPPGLKSMTEAEDSLAEFLRLDPVLLEAAALNSSDLEPTESKSEGLAKWLRGVPTDKKDLWLLELASHPEHAVRRELLLEFRESQRGSTSRAGTDFANRRSIRELYAARDAQTEVYERRIAKEAAQKKALAAKKAAKKRDGELDALSKRIDAAWKELEARLATTSTNRFIKAVEDLTDLRELAARDDDLDKFRTRLEKLMERHADKPTFQNRVSKALLSR